MKRTWLLTSILLVLFATSAFAISITGILGTFKNAITAVGTSGSLWVGLTIVVLAWLFKTIPNEKIYGTVEKLFTKLGTICTLGLCKFKYTAPLWNKYIEPWVIDFIDNTVGAAVRGFIAGLRSDNPVE